MELIQHVKTTIKEMWDAPYEEVAQAAHELDDRGMQPREISHELKRRGYNDELITNILDREIRPHTSATDKSGHPFISDIKHADEPDDDGHDYVGDQDDGWSDDPDKIERRRQAIDLSKLSIGRNSSMYSKRRAG